jgi:hypothetical protein
MSSTTLQAPRVDALVKRGWRRRLLVLTVDQSALVLSLLFGALALLILLGTQILAWQWLLAVATIAMALAVFAVRRRLAGSYQVAQMMDRHLSLNDSLSTAWFLQTHAAEADPAAAYQLARAEKLAETADPALAFPFERRKSWIVTGALFLLALGLFSARYLVTRELSLAHSFLPLVITQAFDDLRHATTDTGNNNPDIAGRQVSSLPPGALGQDAAHPRLDQKAAEPGQNPASPPGGAANAKGDQTPSQNSEQAKSADGQGGDQKRNASGGGPSSKAANAEAAKQASDPADKQDSNQQSADGTQRSSSMLDRMRDALSSVMAKIKPSANSPNPQSASQKNADGQKSSDPAADKDQSGDGQKDAGKEQSAQEQSSGEQQGQGAAKAQASKGKDSAQPSDRKGSDAQSGVGHSDGDKAVQAAEQAKAMGKLAEIFGKRSASLTGDMQIEPSGKQRLQTGYTHQQGRHSDLGGEINRDEVPVEDQAYIREYMELVRKQGIKAPTAH